MRHAVRTRILFAVAVFLLVGGPAVAQESGTPPGGGEAGARDSARLLPTGAAAPAFRLADVNGGFYSHGGRGAGNPLLLAFFSVFCDPCRTELTVLQRIQEKYGDRVKVAAVSLDGKVLQGTVAGFAKQEGYTFRILLDEVTDRQVFRAADAFRVTEMPTLYLVDGGGNVAFAGTGRVAEDTLEKAVKAALAK